MPSEQAVNPLVQLPVLPLIVIFCIFYFLVIRPQKQEQKKQNDMRTNLKKNDKVVMAGGIHGTVVLVKDKTVVVRVDEDAKIEFDKEAVLSVTKTQSND